MIILGIDPGSLFTGFGVVQKEAKLLSVIEFGTIEMGAKTSHPSRLKRIYSELAEVIDRHKPDECAIEMPIYGGNPQSMLKLGRAQAAAMLAAMHRQIPVVEYTPKEVKKSVTGNGNASKKQVAFMICQILEITGEIKEDSADALAVSLCHANRSGHSSSSRYKNWDDFVKANPDRIH